MLVEHETPGYRQEREFVDQSLPDGDEGTVDKAITVLGHLARLDSTATEFIEQQLRRALEWLRPSKDGGQQLRVACLVVAELAENAPTLTYLHIRQVKLVARAL